VLPPGAIAECRDGRVRARISQFCQFLIMLPLLASAWAQAADSPAIIKRVAVERRGTRVEVKIVLSQAVTPVMSTATAPERVLLDFPNTNSSPHQRHIAVGEDGVEAVRYGLNESKPPVTRLVVELERAGKYELATAGNEIVLTIMPGPSAAATVSNSPVRTRRRFVPPAAANPPWISLSGKQNSTASVGTPASTALPAPPMSHGSVSPPAVSPSPTLAQAPLPQPVVPAQAPPPASQPAAAPQPHQAAVAEATASPAESGGSEPQLSARPSPVPTSRDEPAAANPDIRTVFRVKYVAESAVYLDGGRADGLAEGVALVIKDAPSAQPPSQSNSAPAPLPAIAAHLKVSSVAQNSAVCEIGSSTRQVKPGDLAYLTSGDAEALVQQRALSSTRVYPQVITFSEGDPMDEEVRDEVPRPPLPEINRTRLLIGFDYGGISTRGSSAMSSSQFGMVMRTDMTRIGGSYWNLRGYWRGELNSASSSSQPTMQDLLNRTYTIGLSYENPQSHWVAGVGRLYLPWATSLDVIDGGYGGRRFGKHVTAGLFAGTSPDPTSWSYNPDRRVAGNFVNFENGSYDGVHYTTTMGMGVSTLLWQVDRPFIFLENGVSYKRVISVYQALQADKPRGTPATPSPGAGISRSYVTVRVQPISRLSLDFNHNYFRDVPTYNLSLVGTGLLDTVLFQGFSAGARVETVKKIYLYTEQGRSSRSGDARNSWNRMYGITFGRLWKTGMTADLHYATFDSAFARGTYRALSLSRSFGERFQGEVQVGKQAFVSPLTSDNGSKFLNTRLETQFGTHYFLAGGYNLQRGLAQNYDQWYFTLGYRFDSRVRGAK
jgi:AMIN domain-containing protein